LVIFVDGFQTTTGYFSYISPNEIESITVLKDPVSLASFGMRGANGVLWVTTKRGVAQKQKVQASLVTGSQQPISLSKPYGSYDYARLYNQALSNDGYALNGNQLVWKPRFSDTELQAFQNGLIGSMRPCARVVIIPMQMWRSQVVTLVQSMPLCWIT
jgi:TonB-dependent SusC/RagA subfamily outer membrane receptor